MQRDNTSSGAGDVSRASAGNTPQATSGHPTREQWMDWLYDEMPADTHAALQTHLAKCRQCEAQVNAWRGAMRELDGWSVPAPAADVHPVTLIARLRAASHRFKWAAAAVLLLSAGWVAGNAKSSISPKQLNAAVETQVARQMNVVRAELANDLKQANATHFAAVETNRVEFARLIAELTATVNEGRAADQQNVVTAFKEFDAKWLAIYASFRRELETVAILTESGLKDTQQQLVQIANSTETQK